MIVASMTKAAADGVEGVERYNTTLGPKLGVGEFSARPHPHAGQAVDAFCRVTAPTRRYGDLVCQRVLLAHVDGRALPYTTTDIAAIAARLSGVERAMTGRAAVIPGERQGPEDQHETADDVTQAPQRPVGKASDPHVTRAAHDIRVGKLEARTIYALLFSEDSQPSPEVRRTLLDAMAAQVNVAPSVLSIVVLKRSWPQVTYRSHQTKAGVAATAHVVTENGELSGQESTASNKKTARQRAALSLLEVLAGGASPKREPLSPRQLDRLAHALEIAAAAISQSAVVRLNNIAQVAGGGPARWTVTQAHGKDGRTCRAQCVIAIAGRVFTTLAHADDEQAAKRAGAQMAIDEFMAFARAAMQASPGWNA